MSNRYEIEITVRPLSDHEQEDLARLGLFPREFVAFARMGNAVEWATDDGAVDAAAWAAGKAIRERLGRGDLIVEEDDDDAQPSHEGRDPAP